MGSSIDSTSVEVCIEESEEGLLLESLKSGNNSNLNGHKTVILDLNFENQDILIKAISIDVNAIVSLNLSHCNLNYFPDAFSTLKLKRLNLSHNKFKDVPVSLKNGLRNLENLDLSYNELQKFETEPKCVIKLRILRINNNNFINIPRWILEVNCFNLEELYYSYNETNCLKKSRFDRVNTYRLKKLELKNCLLRSQDLKFLKNIRTLTSLDLSNESEKIRNSFISDDTLSIFFENPVWNDRLTILSLNGLQISFLPEEIGQLIVLEELYLSRNDLMWLPGSLSSLERLRILDISNNHVVSLPTTVNRLNNLEILFASCNAISSTPDLSDTKLKVLDLYHNYLDIDCDIKINNINEIDLEQNFFPTCDLNDQGYEEKKTALRMRMVEGRCNGPKVNPYDQESFSSGDTSTDSEWNYDQENLEGSCKEPFEEEESWSPKREICDNGCTSSDNEWTGYDKIYVRKKIKPVLDTPEWMFDDD